jgi:hypothetical protein
MMESDAIEDYREFIEYTQALYPDVREKLTTRARDMQEAFESKCQAFIALNSAKRMKLPFPSDGGKVFAIGDIHADYCTFVVCLKLARVIPEHFTREDHEETCQWIGGHSIVVQVGDLIGGECHGCDCDYGKKEERHKLECVSFLRIVKLIDVLNKQAKPGAGIVTLFGNHEMRHILTYNELITSSSSIRLRKDISVPLSGDTIFEPSKKCYRAEDCPFYSYERSSGKWVQQRGPPSDLKNSHINEIRQSRLVSGYDEDVDPTGYHSHQNIFQPGGLMSNYLGCATHAILMIGDWIFVHGGVTQRFLEDPLFSGIADDQKKLAFYNMLLKDYILSDNKEVYYFLTPGDKQAFFSEMFEEASDDRSTVVSPIWNNKFGVKLGRKCGHVDRILERIQMNHMVIGHVPQFWKKITPEELSKPKRHNRYSTAIHEDAFINACETKGRRTVFRTDVSMSYRGCKHRAQIMEISADGSVMYVANKASNRRDPDIVQRYEERISP